MKPQRIFAVLIAIAPFLPPGPAHAASTLDDTHEVH